jgi:hypothetical protein
MLEELFGELKNLLWGIGIISVAIVSLLLLPKKISNKLGEHPVFLFVIFSGIMLAVIRIFN